MGNYSRPLVSVLTPTYNHAAYIVDCIESVQQQTLSDWEQIIIDDGSSDETGNVIQQHLSDPRIKYIRQENQGIWRLAESYNTALKESSGEFVAILEGDDLWPADKLQRQLPLFEDGSVGMSYGRIRAVDESGMLLQDDILRVSEWQPPLASFADSSPLPFLRDLLLLRGNVGNVSVIYRRAALDSVGGFYQPPGFPAADFSTHIKLATIHRVSFLDHTLGLWRYHEGQTTDAHNLAYSLGTTQVALEYFRSLPQEAKAELQISEKDIWEARREYVVNAYWRAARAAMRQNQWSRARGLALKMMKHGGKWRKSEGAATYLASIFQVNLDPIVDKAARHSIGKRIVQP